MNSTTISIAVEGQIIMSPKIRFDSPGYDEYRGFDGEEIFSPN